MCAAPRPLCAATDSETLGSTRASSSMTDAVVDGGHAGAAVLGGKLNAHQAEVGQLGQQLRWKVLRFVPLPDVRLDFGFGKLANAATQQRLVVGQTKVHR